MSKRVHNSKGKRRRKGNIKQKSKRGWGYSKVMLHWFKQFEKAIK
jgi:hypothetical protein